MAKLSVHSNAGVGLLFEGIIEMKASRLGFFGVKLMSARFFGVVVKPDDRAAGFLARQFFRVFIRQVQVVAHSL